MYKSSVRSIITRYHRSEFDNTNKILRSLPNSYLLHRLAYDALQAPFSIDLKPIKACSARNKSNAHRALVIMCINVPFSQCIVYSSFFSLNHQCASSSLFLHQIIASILCTDMYITCPVVRFPQHHDVITQHHSPVSVPTPNFFLLRF